MTNTNYKDYPFTAKGINFISRIYSNSPFVSQIALLPKGVFDSMNIKAIEELLSVKQNFTLEEIQEQLDKINAGGSHAFVLLGDN